MKKAIAFIFSVICCFVCLASYGKTVDFEQPPSTVLVIVADSQGGRNYLKASWEENEEILYLEKTLSFEREEGKILGILFEGVFDLSEEPLDSAFYQENGEQNFWEFSLDGVATQKIKRSYYMNRYNDHGVLPHTYTICCDLKIVIS